MKTEPPPPALTDTQTHKLPFHIHKFINTCHTCFCVQNVLNLHEWREMNICKACSWLRSNSVVYCKRCTVLFNVFLFSVVDFKHHRKPVTDTWWYKGITLSFPCSSLGCICATNRAHHPSQFLWLKAESWQNTTAQKLLPYSCATPQRHTPGWILYH